MRLPSGLRAILTLFTVVVLVVIYVPLGLVLLNSVNTCFRDQYCLSRPFS